MTSSPNSSCLDGVPAAFALLSPRARSEFLDGILACCATHELGAVSAKCQELLQCDFIAALPREVSRIVLRLLDVPTLLVCVRVCRRWREVLLSLGRALWRDVQWPCPMNMSRCRAAGDLPPHIVAGEEMRRWRLLRLPLLCNGIEVSSDKLRVSWEAWNDALSTVAWNGGSLLAVFPAASHGEIYNVSLALVPGRRRSQERVVDAGKFPFDLPGGCRVAKFFGRSELVASSYRGFSMWLFSIDNVTCTLRAEYQGHGNLVQDFAVARGRPDILVSVSKDRTAKVWHYQRAVCLVTINLDLSLSPRAVVAQVASGSTIDVAVSFRQCVELYRVNTDECGILPATGQHILWRVDRPAATYDDVANKSITMCPSSVYFYSANPSREIWEVCLHADGATSGSANYTVYRRQLTHAARESAVLGRPCFLHPLPDSDGLLYMQGDLSLWQWTRRASDRAAGGGERQSKASLNDLLCPGHISQAATLRCVCINWPMTYDTIDYSNLQPLVLGATLATRSVHFFHPWQSSSEGKA